MSQVHENTNYIRILTTLKKNLAGKGFGFNEEMIAETEAYLATKNKSFGKKGILKKRTIFLPKLDVIYYSSLLKILIV